MAYVPDEAISQKFNKLTGREYKLFTYFCKRADGITGECFPSVDTIAMDLGWRKNHVYQTRRNLARKHRIGLKGDLVKILSGFPRPKNWSQNGSELSPEMGAPTPKMGLKKSQNGTSLPCSEPDQLTRPTEPSAPIARAAIGRTVEEPKSRIRGQRQTTRNHKSRFTREECIEYARALQESGREIRSLKGFGRWLWISGDADNEIADWITAGKQLPAHISQREDEDERKRTYETTSDRNLRKRLEAERLLRKR